MFVLVVLGRLFLYHGPRKILAFFLFLCCFVRSDDEYEYHSDDDGGGEDDEDQVYAASEEEAEALDPEEEFQILVSNTFYEAEGKEWSCFVVGWLFFFKLWCVCF